LAGTIQQKLNLTPALSHRMGEGERDPAAENGPPFSGGLQLSETPIASLLAVSMQESNRGWTQIDADDRETARVAVVWKCSLNGEPFSGAENDSPSPIGWERAGVRVDFYCIETAQLCSSVSMRGFN
jgi:hypothetical protein